jgi:outer membrane receptor protein involved in Fe transport
VAIDTPFNILDASNLFGWQFGSYVQDEWRLTDQLIFNYGLRFDQIFQYVDANQFSPPEPDLHAMVVDRITHRLHADVHTSIAGSWSDDSNPNL